MTSLFDILEFLDKYKIYLIIALIVIALICFFLIEVFVISRNRYRRQIKDLETKYNFIHEQLVNDDKNLIGRIEFISSRNVIYLQIHQQYSERYSALLNKQDKQSYLAITSLKELVDAKNYRGIKDIIESTRTSVSEFDKAVNGLSEDLWVLLKPDEEIRQQAVKEKEKLRNLKDSFNEHITELKAIESSFDLVFNAIEKRFSEFEELLDAANYDDAKEKLPTIAKLLDAMTRTMNDIPFLTTLATQVVPQRIQELQHTYEELEEEKYPLHHLQIKFNIEKIQSKLDDIVKRLGDFRLEGIKAELDEIIDIIDIFFRQFEEEKEAKSLFDKEQSHISDNTYELEREFSKLKRYLPEFKSIYVIDDKYLDQLTMIQSDIDRMGAIKRDLDTFIHSSTKQPYSILLKKMRDLQSEMKKITTTMSDFRTYLSSLKSNSEKSYREIRIWFKKLKEAEYIVRTINVQALSDTLELQFRQAYTYLDDLDEIIKTQPIDVRKLERINSEASVLIDSLLAEVNTQEELSIRAEDAIVYANQIRTEFGIAKSTLIVAENSFNEADFGRASSEALGIIKKMRPEGNE